MYERFIERLQYNSNKGELLAALQKLETQPFGAGLLLTHLTVDNYRHYANPVINFCGRELESVKKLNPRGKQDLLNYTTRLVTDQQKRFNESQLSDAGKAFVDWYRSEISSTADEALEEFLADTSTNEYSHAEIAKGAELAQRAFGTGDSKKAEAIIAKLIKRHEKGNRSAEESVHRALQRVEKHETEGWQSFIYQSAMSWDAGEAVGNIAINKRFINELITNPEAYLKTAYCADFDAFSPHQYYERLQSGFREFLDDITRIKNTSVFKEVLANAPESFGQSLTLTLLDAKSQDEYFVRILEFLTVYCHTTGTQPSEKMYELLYLFSADGIEFNKENAQAELLEFFAGFKSWLRKEIEIAQKAQLHTAGNDDQLLNKKFIAPLMKALLLEDRDAVLALFQRMEKHPAILRHGSNDSTALTVSMKFRGFVSDSRSPYNLLLTQFLYENDPEVGKEIVSKNNYPYIQQRNPEYIHWSLFAVDVAVFSTIPDNNRYGSIFLQTVDQLRGNSQRRKIAFKALEQESDSSFGIRLLKAMLEPESDEHMFVSVFEVVAEYLQELKKTDNEWKYKELLDVLLRLETENNQPLPGSLSDNATGFYREYKQAGSSAVKKKIEELLNNPVLLTNSYQILRKEMTTLGQFAQTNPEETLKILNEICEKLKLSNRVKSSDPTPLDTLESAFNSNNASEYLRMAMWHLAEKRHALDKMDVGDYRYRRIVERIEKQVRGKLSERKVKGNKERLQRAVMTVEHVFAQFPLSTSNPFRDALLNRVERIRKRQYDQLLDRLAENPENQTLLYVEFLVLCEAASEKANRNYNHVTEILMTFYPDFLENAPISKEEKIRIFHFLGKDFYVGSQQPYLAPIAAKAFNALPDGATCSVTPWKYITQALLNRECEADPEILRAFVERTEKFLEQDAARFAYYFNRHPNNMVNLLTLAAKAGMSEKVNQWLKENKNDILAHPGTYIALLPYGYKKWTTENLSKNLNTLVLNNMRNFSIDESTRQASAEIIATLSGDTAFTAEILYATFPVKPELGRNPRSIRIADIPVHDLTDRIQSHTFADPELRKLCFHLAGPIVSPDSLPEMIENYLNGKSLQQLSANPEASIDDKKLLVKYLQHLILKNDKERFSEAVNLSGEINSQNWSRCINSTLKDMEDWKYMSHLSFEDAAFFTKKILEIFRKCPQNYTNSIRHYDLFTDWFFYSFMTDQPSNKALEILTVAPENRRKDIKINTRRVADIITSRLTEESSKEDMNNSLETLLGFCFLTEYSQRMNSTRNLLTWTAKRPPFKTEEDKWLVIGAEFLAEHNVKKELKRYKKRFNKIKDDDLKARALKTLE